MAKNTRIQQSVNRETDRGLRRLTTRLTVSKQLLKVILGAVNLTRAVTTKGYGSFLEHPCEAVRACEGEFQSKIIFHKAL